ncbi:MAG: VCBS repeat-containing protein [Thermodesulfobacteriota bacterium]
MSVLRTIRPCLVALVLILISSSFTLSQEQSRPTLAILPFKLNGPVELNYLQEGVRTMLASRIAAKTGATVISSQKGDGADLLLSGSITALGPSLSIDARLLRVAGNESASFFTTAENQGEILGAVDKLSEEISVKMSKAVWSPPPVVKETPAASPPAVTTQAVTEEVVDKNLHPDRMFMVPAVVPVPTASVPVVKPGVGVGSVKRVTRSQFLDMELQVMAVGDVFGDGDEVLVLAEKQKVFFYRQDGNRLVAAGAITDGPKYARVVALNLADLNGNGRAEVYVSASSGNGPSSYAAEWNGSSFVRLFDRQRWYVRPLELPGRGMILAGQEAGSEGPVRAGLYRLANKDGKLQKGEKLTVPETVNLYDFVMADFTGDGQAEIAVQSQQRELLLYNRDGDVLWQGSGKYGYTQRFIGEASGVVSDQPANLQVLTRLVAQDLDQDGRPELIAMKNPDGLGGALKSLSSFTGGSINVMRWNGVTFEEQWSSGEIGSYLATFQVNGPGSWLYLGLVSKRSGLLFGSYQSSVGGYDLSSKGR